MVSRLNQHDAPPAAASMSEDQFAKLVELLTPGYELSCMMLAEYKARMKLVADGAADADRELAEAQRQASEAQKQ